MTEPDSTVVEDSNIATQVEVDAVGIANVKLYVKIDRIVEAFKRAEKKALTQKTFSHLNKMVSGGPGSTKLKPFKQDTYKYWL